MHFHSIKTMYIQLWHNLNSFLVRVGWPKDNMKPQQKFALDQVNVLPVLQHWESRKSCVSKGMWCQIFVKSNVQIIMNEISIEDRSRTGLGLVWQKRKQAGEMEADDQLSITPKENKEEQHRVQVMVSN